MPDKQLCGDDVRWAAVESRDASCDGNFVYAVVSTGIYCRPSCPSRRPARNNVIFHLTPEAAETAGFRACRRCHPDGEAPAAGRIRAISDACRQIEAADPPPSLADLAAAAGMSTWHFHRQFRTLTGVTPKAYAQACRDRRLRDGLAGSDSVTTAMLDAGFGSSASFYTQSGASLGMRPATYRAGGSGEVIRFGFGSSSLGEVLVAATGQGIVAILLGDNRAALLADLKRRLPAAEHVEMAGELARLIEAVIALVDRPRQSVDLPLDVRGTAFQQRVWQALRSIPAGSTVSYAELARRIGSPQAARAVAQACAANPAAVAIPCHRVVRGDGSLSGYRWGTARKRELLRRERED